MTNDELIDSKLIHVEEKFSFGSCQTTDSHRIGTAPIRIKPPAVDEYGTIEKKQDTNF